MKKQTILLLFLLITLQTNQLFSSAYFWGALSGVAAKQFASLADHGPTKTALGSLSGGVFAVVASSLSTSLRPNMQTIFKKTFSSFVIYITLRTIDHAKKQPH